MSIPFRCPHCGKSGNVPESYVGKKARCPGCGQSSTVAPPVQAPAPSAVRESPLPAAVPLSAPVPAHRPSPIVEVVVSAHRPCPFCGESVLPQARKCRHCGEALDPALRAADEARRAAERAERVAHDSGRAQPFVNNVVVGGGSRPFPHGMHLILTLLTCGIWLPVWGICWLGSR